MQIKHPITKFLTSAWCVLFGSTVSMSVVAADENTAGRLALEEIVVTARKHEESLQTFAGAATALSGDQLAANVISNLQDIRNLVPNLYLVEGLGGQSTTKIFIRGIGIDNPAVSFDSPVGIYVDGVYRARAFGSLADLYDIERIEFLRGPQGTLYGRNNSAGALRVITKLPLLDKAEAGGTVGFGTEGQLNANAYWSVPLSQDKAGLRFSVATRSNDGFMTEVNSGRKFKKDDGISGRASFLYIPNERWTFVARGDFVSDDGTGSLASSIVPAFNPDNDIYTANLNLTPDNSLDIFGASIDLSRDGEHINFTSITAYRDIKQSLLGGDADGTPLSLLEGEVQNLDEYQFTEEAFFSSAYEPGGVDWTAGIFYFREENDVEQMFNVFPNVFGPATTQTFTQSTDSFSAYGEADWAVTERVTLTGGLRYTNESKDIVIESFNNDGSFGFNFADGISESRTTWKAVIDFEVSDDFFMYASAGTGFRSGGIGVNPAARNVGNIVGDVFGPETASSYEVGLKSRFLDGAVTLNTTYFYVDYQELQLAVAGAGGITVNTPDATVHGFEGELAANLFENLTLNLTIGTQNDDIKNSDLELKNTPDWQGRLGLTWVKSIGGAGDLTLSGDVSYTDDYFTVTANTIVVESHSLINAMARWDSQSGRWGLSVSGRNLSDKYYPISGFRIIPGLLDNQFPNYPRRYMVEVHIKY